MGFVFYAKPHPFLLYEACRQTGTAFTAVVVIGRVKVWNGRGTRVQWPWENHSRILPKSSPRLLRENYEVSIREYLQYLYTHTVRYMYI